MIKAKPKMVSEEVGSMSFYELEDTFDGTIATLQAKKDMIVESLTLAKKWTGSSFLYLSKESERYSDHDHYVIYHKREETKQEQKARLEKEAGIASAIEDRERKEYERLQKKFGKKG